jgi:hypothetical protein
MTRRPTSAGTKICAASPRQLATEIFEVCCPIFSPRAWCPSMTIGGAFDLAASA